MFYVAPITNRTPKCFLGRFKCSNFANDPLSGGLGCNELSGGAGKDRFVFGSHVEIGGGDTLLRFDLICDFVLTISDAKIASRAGTDPSASPFS